MAAKIFKVLGYTLPLSCLVSCTLDAKKTSEVKTSENSLRFPIGTNMCTVDPTRCTSMPTYQVLMHIYEGLVSLGEDNEPVPQLASHWTLSKDRKTYTFHIRHDAQFHNGDPVTSEDVKWSLERICDPRTGAPNAGIHLKDIEGLEKRIAGDAKEISGVQTIGADKIRITLKHPRVYFLKKLALPIASVLPKNRVPRGEIIKKDQIIGTGPFILSEHHRGQLVVLKANKNYYGGKPGVNELRIAIVKDRITALNKYKSGLFDFVHVPAIEVPAIQKNPDYKDQLRIYNFSAVYYLELNPKIYKPFESKKVRLAFGMAIDRDYFSNTMLPHIATRATSIIAKGVLGHREDVAEVKFNPEKARELLKEAGYNPKSKKNNLPPLDIFLCTDAPTARKVTENMAMQIRKNLGVPIKVRQVEWGTYISKVNRKEVPFRFAGWTVNSSDPSNFLSAMFTSDSSLNHCNYSNKVYDQLCEEADGLHVTKDRLDLYAKAEDLLLQDGIIYPLYYPKDVYLIRENVKGCRINLNGFLPHFKVRVEKQ